MPLQLYWNAIIFALAAGFGACAVSAAPAPKAPTAAATAALYGCADLTDSAARLACFDAEVAKLRTAEAAGTFRAVDKQSVEQLQREAFGFQLPSLPRLGLPKLASGDGPSKQSFVVTAVQAGERPAFTMADGSVWRMTESAPYRLIKPGVEVVVEKAALGSFIMAPAKSNNSFRVRREQ
jgi:hypothetical protein